MGLVVPPPVHTSEALRKEPSARGYGHELMAIEREAIERGHAWLAANRGQRSGWEPLASFDLYALEAQAPAWLRSKAAQDECVVMGVAPHYRVFALPRLAFFPEGHVPQPRQRIRIEDAHAQLLPRPHPARPSKLTTNTIEIIHVEKWSDLPAESIYFDSDLAAGDVQGFYRDHLRVDDHIVLDFLLPATSAAYGSGGGIDAAGRIGTGRAKQVNEFLWLLTAALPPEYRRRARLASHGEGGYRQDGVAKFRFQDLPPPGTHTVASQVVPDASRLHTALHRPPAAWESSLYATLNVPSRGESDQLKAFLREFTSAHCALPETIPGVLAMDVDLTGFERGIDSSLHKAHVMLRAQRPTAGTMDDKLPDAASNSRLAIDAALGPYMPDERSRQRFVRHLMKTVPAHLGQTGLALARLEGRDGTARDAVDAYRLLKSNLDHTMEHGDIKRIRLEWTENALQADDPKQQAADAIESCLIAEGPMHLSALAESLQGSPGLESAEDVPRIVDAMTREGLIYQRGDGRHAWVG